MMIRKNWEQTGRTRWRRFIFFVAIRPWSFSFDRPAGIIAWRIAWRLHTVQPSWHILLWALERMETPKKTRLTWKGTGKRPSRLHLCRQWTPWWRQNPRDLPPHQSTTKDKTTHEPPLLRDRTTRKPAANTRTDPTEAIVDTIKRIVATTIREGTGTGKGDRLFLEICLDWQSQKSLDRQLYARVFFWNYG